MNAIYDKHTAIIGKRLYALAVDWTRNGIPTIRAASDQIECVKGRKTVINGSRAKRVAVDAVIAAAKEMQSVRDPRRKSSREARTSLATRLERLRKNGVERVYRQTYRSPGKNHGGIYVRTTDDPSKIGVAIEQSKRWDLYGGKYKGWSALETVINLTIPQRWRSRVLHCGLSVVDGMLTLDAQKLEGVPQGVDLFAADWLIQKRGYDVEKVTGFIARSGHESYHADTIKKAINGLRRKLHNAEWQAKIQGASLDKILSRLGDRASSLEVSVNDAKRTGSCEYGIRSWCSSVGLDYESGKATLDRVYSAYLARPQAEARAAILAAIRRQNVNVI